jgi:NADH:ubiquinone oxidoreductase subunit 2 (subunit N)
MRVARQMYIEAPDAESKAPAIGLPTRLALIACVVGVVGMGAMPEPFVKAALEAARGLGL